MSILQVLAIYDELDILLFCLWLLLPVAFSLFVNAAFGLRLFNGLFVMQLGFVANIAPFIALSMHGSVNSPVYFLFLELAIYVLCVFVYVKLLPLSSILLIALAPKLYAYRYAIYLAYLLVIIYEFVSSRDGGGSRIAYMTSPIFSLIKYLILPIQAGFFALLCLDISRKSLLNISFDLLFAGFGSFAAQSKASFVLLFLSAWLFQGDSSTLIRFSFLNVFRLFHIPTLQFGLKLPVLQIVLFPLTLILVFFVVTAIGVVPLELLQRVVLFGESGYAILNPSFLPDPSELTTGLSDLAVFHRGIARFFGDSGALDPDTLFGYAISMKANGGINTLTGPNARISSYFIAYFSDFFQAFIGVLTISFFVFILLFFVVYIARAARSTFSHFILKALAFHFCFYLPSAIPQDYYVLLSTMTTLLFALLVLSLVEGRTFFYSLAKFNVKLLFRSQLLPPF
jgi:hypothetical protein